MSAELLQKRRRARELALQILYAIEVSGQEPEGCMRSIFDHEHADEDERQYAQQLIHGTLAEQQAIDALLERWSQRWSLARMAMVDRNLLRLAAYELLHEEQVPRKVAINEAVEIAKRFGDQKSSAFINAILDKIKPPEPS